jgi:hypothetical protein
MKKIMFLLVFIAVSFFSRAQVGFRIGKSSTTIAGKLTETIKKKGKPDEKVYKTKEITDYNRKQKQKEDKEAEIKRIRDTLYDNSLKENTNPLIGQDSVDEKEKTIAKLEKEIDVLQNLQDSLYYVYTKDYLAYDRAMVFNFGPLRSRAFFDMVYGNGGKTFRALSTAGINFGDNSGSLYSEIVSGNMGLFRVSLGTMVANSKEDNNTEEREQEAYQRLVTYGGNTVLNLEYPLAYLHSKGSQYNFISRLLMKGAADFPAFGTNTEEFAGSFMSGIDFYGDASVRDSNKKNVLTFFFNLNANLVTGTEVYRTNLGIEKANFTFGQLSVGVVFLENFKLSFVVSTFSSEEKLRNRNVVAGGQILR